MATECDRKKLLMVIPINTDQYNANAKRVVEPVLAPDVDLDVVSIDCGTPFIQSRWAIAQNSPHVIERVRNAEKDGYDGVFVSDFDNCGVEPAREVVRIPVIGGFAPQVLTALSLAQTFSIITMSDSLLALDRTHVRAFGQIENLRSIRSIDMVIAQAGADHDELARKVYLRALEAIRKDGAQAIVLGCTAMIGVAEPVTKRLAEDGMEVVVTDPNLVGIAYLQMLVRCGLTQSGLTYLPPENLKQ